MKIDWLVKISVAELLAQKRAVIMAAVTASLVFALVMGISLVLNGIERNLLRSAERVTGGELFVTSVVAAEEDSVEVQRVVREMDGEIVSTIRGDSVLGEGDLERILQQRAGIKLEGEAPYEKVMVSMGMEKGFRLIDLVLDNVRTEYGPSKVMVKPGEVVILMRFANLEMAYRYMDKVKCERDGCKVPVTAETFSNQVSIWRAFENLRGQLVWVVVLLLVVAAVIAMFVGVKFLDWERRQMAIYRVLGATTGDIIAIMLAMMLTVGLVIVGVTVGLASLLAMVVSMVDVGYLTRVMSEFYGMKISGAMLWGWGGTEWIVIAVIMAAVTASLVLMSDQLLTKRVMKQLHEE